MNSATLTSNEVCPLCNATYPAGQEHLCPTLERYPQDQGGTLVGTTIDSRYEIESALQTGGMGVIYKARHVVLGKPLAVKVLREAGDEAARKRFLQEAKSASMLNHSNIVDISDFGVLPNGLPYLVMEFLEGLTLTQALRDGPLPGARVCQIGAQICRGLQAVHDKGIIHRDLKPDNIFLLEREGLRDFVKIVDFGIAKSHSGPRLTQAGMTLGTPEYMSPEQATGSDTDHRVDQYALGCILYELLIGVLPFEGKDAMQTLIKHVTEPVIPPRQRRPDLSVPPSLEAVVLRAMSKNRDDRFSSMREMEQALLAEFDREARGAAVNDRTSAKRALAQTVRMVSSPMQVPGQPEGLRPGPTPSPVQLPQQVASPAQQAPARAQQQPATAERRGLAGLGGAHRNLIVVAIGLGAGILLALLYVLLGDRQQVPPPGTPPAAGSQQQGPR